MKPKDVAISLKFNASQPTYNVAIDKKDFPIVRRRKSQIIKFKKEEIEEIESNEVEKILISP